MDEPAGCNVYYTTLTPVLSVAQVLDCSRCTMCTKPKARSIITVDRRRKPVDELSTSLSAEGWMDVSIDKTGTVSCCYLLLTKAATKQSFMWSGDEIRNCCVGDTKQVVVTGVKQHALLFDCVCQSKKFVPLVLPLVKSRIHPVPEIIGV